jgi:hypothetical protein
LTISFVMSVCLSVCPLVRTEQLGYHWTVFREVWYSIIFRNLVEKIQASLIYDKNNRYFTWKPIYIYFKYLAQFFLEWGTFQTKVAEKIKLRFMISNSFFFFRKSCCFWDNVDKYFTGGQTTGENMAHLICMLDN